MLRFAWGDLGFMFKESTGAGLWFGHAVSTSSPRVIAVFAGDAESSLRVLRHVRSGAAGFPVWLYSTVPPPPEIAALCNRVVVRRGSLRLLATAQRELWPL